MDITIEMIEKVLEATGTDYYTAKKSLIEHDGNVEDAIKEIIGQEAAKKIDHASAVTDETAEDAPEASSNQGSAEETRSGEGLFEEVFSDEYAESMLDRLKERVKAGNVDRIRVSRDGRTIIEVPVNVGMIGGLLGFLTVPWAMILGVITAYGLSCKIQVITSDGKTENIL